MPKSRNRPRKKRNRQKRNKADMRALAAVVDGGDDAAKGLIPATESMLQGINKMTTSTFIGRKYR